MLPIEKETFYTCSMKTIFRVSFLRLILLALMPLFSMLISPSMAALSPLGFSIIPPAQFPSDNFDIAGARLSVLWGRHRQVYGFDLGALGNMTDVGFTGIAASGLFNYNNGTATVIGLQLAGGANINVNKANIYGLQIALGLNSNQAESSLVGLQFAAINYGPTLRVYGIQAGIYNRAQIVNGFQIGLFNDTDVLRGIQIGLVNIHRRGLFSMAPIINIGF
jgi:hypothetical protein